VSWLEDFEADAYGRHGIGRLRAGLFRQQRELLDDVSKRKTARCSRRAGKTRACLVRSAELCSTGTILYVVQTRLMAKVIFWEPLQEFNRQYGLGLTFNESELIARSQTGGTVIVAGADDRREIDKKRGLAYDLVILDEAGSYQVDLAGLVNEVLEPALLDRNGELWLTGTPNPSCQGYFHDADTALPGYSRHHWTLYDNPYVKGREFVEAQIQTRGLALEDPYVQREYFGQWVPGGGRLVYRFDPAKNIYEELPTLREEWRYVIGCDVGWLDSTAFAVLAYHPSHPTTYEVFSAKRAGMLSSEIAGTLQELCQTYRNAYVFMDTGGGGKRVAEDLKARFGLPIEAADKKDKISGQALLNSDLALSKVKVRRQSPVITEWLSLQQLPDGKEDPTVHNDLADAFLYAYKACYQWVYREPKPKPLSINDPRWMDEYENAKVIKLERARKEAQKWKGRNRG
jgi:hypothetical protein